MSRTWKVEFLIDAPDDVSDLEVESVIASELEGVGITFDGENFPDARDITAEFVS